MKERPILFSGDMVRAILEGRKTQTRRIVKFDSQKDGLPIPEKAWVDNSYHHEKFGNVDCLKVPYTHGITLRHFPEWEAGDVLWVRETWAEHPEIPGTAMYRANRGGDYQGSAQGLFNWKPSIHMPRWASRISLEVTAVRVERLQDISEEDARAEGVAIQQDAKIAARVAEDTPARMEFWHLWQSIYGPESWDSNPWVWAITFRRVK